MRAMEIERERMGKAGKGRGGVLRSSPARDFPGMSPPRQEATQPLGR
jgi:hypothetical protein